jgi:hypothetical protein
MPAAHFRETERMARALTPAVVGKWLLDHGYFPENYVLPPCFKTSNFTLNTAEYYPVKGKNKYSPPESETADISFPKSLLTVRTYGVSEPSLYHDLAFNVAQNWKAIVDVLFSQKLKIYSYSFPIPVTKKKINGTSDLRAGRMIYEFIEMAENDLVSEAHRFNYLVKADISAFYPSIYTHTISWALHSKATIRSKGNRNNYALFGNKIDKLLQVSNDGCTNGIPVGSAMSDLISEILLAYVDAKTSDDLAAENIDFVGVRFKDDYRILCSDQKIGSQILGILQKNLAEVNLTLSESKTSIRELPEGLYREWTSAYSKLSLSYKRTIRYKFFEDRFLSVLEIDKRYPGTGVIDRFLNDLLYKSGRLKVRLNAKEKPKFLSLLILLKGRRPKSFPKILALIELAYLETKSQEFRDRVKRVILEMLSAKAKTEDDDEYELLWLLYFAKKILGIRYRGKVAFKNRFLESVRRDRQEFFTSFTGGDFYVKLSNVNKTLNEHLRIF